MLTRPAGSFVCTDANSPLAREHSPDEFLVRFWGVRGGIACPGPSTAKYGGNTACVEIRCGEHTIIFDGGTGIRPLGQVLADRGSAVDADIFFSHFHLDHVCGFPFFAPCYSPTSRLRLWSGALMNDCTIERAMNALTTPPLYPLRLDQFNADIQFRCFGAGETIWPRSDVRVQTRMLNHPGGALGYRLEFAGCSLAYITDTEHCPGELDPNVLELARGVNLMIYDGNYTDEEYPQHVGWGHSTWQQGVRLANAAGAETLAIFHHDPAHHDDVLDQISARAKATRPGTIIASEGLTVRLESKTNVEQTFRPRPLQRREDPRAIGQGQR